MAWHISLSVSFIRFWGTFRRYVAEATENRRFTRAINAGATSLLLSSMVSHLGLVKSASSDNTRQRGNRGNPHPLRVLNYLPYLINYLTQTPQSFWAKLDIQTCALLEKMRGISSRSKKRSSIVQSELRAPLDVSDLLVEGTTRRL